MFPAHPTSCSPFFSLLLFHTLLLSSISQKLHSVLTHTLSLSLQLFSLSSPFSSPTPMPTLPPPSSSACTLIPSPLRPPTQPTSALPPPPQRAPPHAPFVQPPPPLPSHAPPTTTPLRASTTHPHRLHLLLHQIPSAPSPLRPPLSSPSIASSDQPTARASPLPAVFPDVSHHHLSLQPLTFAPTQNPNPALTSTRSHLPSSSPRRLQPRPAPINRRPPRRLPLSCPPSRQQPSSSFQQLSSSLTTTSSFPVAISTALLRSVLSNH